MTTDVLALIIEALERRPGSPGLFAIYTPAWHSLIHILPNEIVLEVRARFRTLSARAYGDPAMFAVITQPLIERLVADRP